MTGRKYPMGERVGIVPPRAPERLTTAREGRRRTTGPVLGVEEAI